MLNMGYNDIFSYFQEMLCHVNHENDMIAVLHVVSGIMSCNDLE